MLKGQVIFSNSIPGEWDIFEKKKKKKYPHSEFLAVSSK